MNSAVLIVARMASTRLKRKPLLPLGDRRVIDQLILRLRQVRSADGIILCTTVAAADHELETVAHEHHLAAFRGSEANVPARLLFAARQYALDFCVVVEGDEIFVDPAYVDRIIAAAHETGADFITLDGFPIGAYLLGIRTSALEKVCSVLGTGDDVNTDGWGRYFTQTGWFKSMTIQPADEQLRRPDYRFTLDYPEDYALVQAVYDRLYQPDRVVPLRDTLALLDGDPELVAINHQRVAEYKTHTAHYPPLKLVPEASQ
jgi:spore coat polysaccharide biosynthesis protein SpsF